MAGTAPLAVRLLAYGLSCGLASGLAAQIPPDHALVLVASVNVNDDAFRLVDLRHGGATALRRQSVFIQMNSVAVDPTNPRQFFFEANPVAFAGTWRAQVGSLATLGNSSWGQWTRTPADRLEVGTSKVFTMRAGVVEATPKTGGVPAVFTTVPGASDLAATDTHLYCSVFDALAAQPVVEVDLLTGAQRPLAAVRGALSIAATAGSTRVLVGTDRGELIAIDATTGQIVSTTPTSLGQISALGADRSGAAIYSDGTSIYSEAAPTAPLYTSPNQAILDFAVSRVAVAAITPFGASCVPAGGSNWLADTTPYLGNLGFRLTATDVRGAAVAFTLGTSRAVASALGGAPLPFALANYGAPGCALLADPVVVLPGAAAGTYAEASVPIPNSPWLRGRRLYAQYLIANGGTNALGLYASEGVTLAID